MRKVYVSVFVTRENGLAAHILTKTMWNRLFWLERAMMENSEGNHEVYVGYPKNVSWQEAKAVALATMDAWVKAGSPSHKQIVANIRKENLSWL